MGSELRPEIIDDLVNEYYHLVEEAIPITDWSKGYASLPTELSHFEFEMCLRAAHLCPLLARALVLGLERDEQVPFALGSIAGMLHWMNTCCCEGAEELYEQDDEIDEKTARAAIGALKQLDLAQFGEEGLCCIYEWLADYGIFCSDEDEIKELLRKAAFDVLRETDAKKKRGRDAYAKEDYQLAFEELSQVQEKLDGLDRKLLADSCRRLGQADEAINQYREIIRASAYATVGNLAGIVLCLVGESRWQEAQGVLVSEMKPYLDQQDARFNQDQIAECLWWMGYVGAQMDAQQARDASRCSFSVREAYASAREAWCDCSARRLKRSVVAEQVVAPLWTVAGYASGLADAYRGKVEELNRIVEDSKHDRVEQSRELTRMHTRLDQEGIDTRPYEAVLEIKYPGLPREAREFLGSAECLWERRPSRLPPHLAMTALASGLEDVLRCGLLERLAELAASGGTQWCIQTSNPRVWLGTKEGRQYVPEKVNLGEVSWFFKPSLDRSVRHFIEEVCPVELRDWLLNQASEEIRRVAAVRNLACHSGPLSWQEVSEIHGLIYNKGLLDRLLAVGGLK